MATLLSLALLVSVQVAADEGSPPDDSTEPDATPAVLTDAVQPVLEPYGLWDDLAQCESTQRWHLDTGNGYYGGLQEDLTFWRRHGGSAYASRPDLASREAQIAVARVGLKVQGWSAWPACSRRLGLR